jgi:hypothetical protein
VAHVLCEQLKKIVGLLEKDDSEAAARAAREMQDGLSALSESMEPAEVAECQELLRRYSELGGKLRERILGDMNRLGSVRRSLAYGQHGRRP